VSAPIELAMEEALRPGRYISEHASFSVVNELEWVAARIAAADSERARHGSDSRAGARLPGEGPRPLGSAGMIPGRAERGAPGCRYRGSWCHAR